MKIFAWDEAKNELLKRGRGISFEEVVYHINSGDLVDRRGHPNKERYPGQQIFVVVIEGYVYAVPFVEDEEKCFLKTIIPSRKLTREYLGERKDEHENE